MSAPPIILPSRPAFLDDESNQDVKQRQTIAAREGLSKQLELEAGLSKEAASKAAGLQSSRDNYDEANGGLNLPPLSLPSPADGNSEKTEHLSPDWVRAFLVVDALVDGKRQQRADAFITRLNRDSSISMKNGNIFEGAKNRGSLTAAIALLFQPTFQKVPQLHFFRRYTRPKEALPSRGGAAGEREKSAAKRRIAEGFKRLSL